MTKFYPTILTYFALLFSFKGLSQSNKTHSGTLKTANVVSNQKEAENRVQQVAQQAERKRDDSLNVTRKKQSEFEETDYGQLTESIRDKYRDWAKRGEFETTEQANQRVNAEGAAEFDKIQQAETANSKTRFLRNWENTYAFLDRYNIDRGTYTLILEPSNSYSNSRSDTVSVAIPVQAAKALKASYYVDRPLYVPVQVSLMDNQWHISKAVVLFNFSTKATQCIKQLGLSEREFVKLKGGTSEGWVLNCESCDCANPIALKNLVRDYASIPPRPAQQMQPQQAAAPASRPKGTMSRTMSGGQVAAGLGVAVFSSVIGIRTPIKLPQKANAATKPVESAPKAQANIYWVEWNELSSQQANLPITRQSLGLLKN